MKIADSMMKRFLEGARKFEEAGFDGNFPPDEKAHQWEKACLAGMCAYLLDALRKVDPGEATIVSSFLIDADENGEDLSVWVMEQLARQDACPRCGGLDGTHTVRDCGERGCKCEEVTDFDGKFIGISGNPDCPVHGEKAAGPEQTQPGEVKA